MVVGEQAVGAMQAYLRLKRYILPSGIAREALQAAVPFLSQPSAARELALEEAARAAENAMLEYNLSECAGLADWAAFEAGQESGLVHAAAAIRVLSSPDHADAGKSVEGDDGRPCSMDEFMAALFNEQADEFDISEAAESWVHGDWKEALSYLTDVPTHWRPLPSAPASEGAE
ncbi:hypothetical protein [Brucella anthropi]|uniref:hypothetical protein n=1 Tax=Brucella anthropi TaxID=529 RepID=UPI0005BDF45D|nr:hypothetical protein [Brucella anthropi]KIU66145.1 hypothetical protein TR92_20355 [Brucella anthropi]